MRFKIQGEQENLENKNTTIVEILGKKAIEKLIDEKIQERYKELSKEVNNLKDRVYKLEEESTIKRKELLKFKD